MTKKELAHALRQRQLQLFPKLRAQRIANGEDIGHFTRDMIRKTSDDVMILSYVTCSCCGEMEVPEKTLWDIVENCCCVDDFFNRLDAQHVN